MSPNGMVLRVCQERHLPLINAGLWHYGKPRSTTGISRPHSVTLWGKQRFSSTMDQKEAIRYSIQGKLASERTLCLDLLLLSARVDMSMPIISMDFYGPCSKDTSTCRTKICVGAEWFELVVIRVHKAYQSCTIKL